MTVLPTGALGQEQSLAFGAWFPNSAGRPFFDVLASDENTQLMLRLGWDAVIADILPLEVNLEQLPSKLVINGRHFSLAYRPILEGERLLAVLLSVSDITGEIERMRSEVQQREFIGVFERAMKDRNGFIEFFDETSRILDELAAEAPIDDTALLRQVHTLKGNSAVFGVTSMSELCNELETLAHDEGIAAMRAQLPRIDEHWLEFARRIVPLIGQKTDDIIEVHHDDLQAIIDSVKQLPAADLIVAQLARLKCEPTTIRFERAAEQAKGLAQRLEKGAIHCVIDSGNVRLPRERWASFFGSLVHVVRNAVDHGLECESERVAAGKSPRGTLSFRSREVEGRFIIEVEDDGRGINWAMIRERAAAKGLPTATEADLVSALFADGISTRETATELSGRGVGMAAVEQAFHALHGRIDVRSTLGKSTTFVFTFPVLGNERSPKDSRFPGSRPSLRVPKRLAKS